MTKGLIIDGQEQPIEEDVEGLVDRIWAEEMTRLKAMVNDPKAGAAARFALAFVKPLHTYVIKEKRRGTRAEMVMHALGQAFGQAIVRTAGETSDPHGMARIATDTMMNAMVRAFGAGKPSKIILPRRRGVLMAEQVPHLQVPQKKN